MNEETVTTNGPEASADGKRNAYYVMCPVVGHSRHYAACLRLCESDRDSKLQSMYGECASAITKKQCPALQMRREEIEAHKAIYFVERMRNRFTGLAQSAASFLSEAGRKAVAEMSKIAPVKSTPSHKSSVIDSIDTTSYADVITKAASKPAPVITPVPKVEPKAGESLLEMAKRLMADKTTTKE